MGCINSMYKPSPNGRFSLWHWVSDINLYNILSLGWFKGKSWPQTVGFSLKMRLSTPFPTNCRLKICLNHPNDSRFRVPSMLGLQKKRQSRRRTSHCLLWRWKIQTPKISWAAWRWWKDTWVYGFCLNVLEEAIGKYEIWQNDMFSRFFWDVWLWLLF